MDLNEYQRRSITFRAPTASPPERVYGLLEEAGEMAGVFKRYFRGDYPNGEFGPKLAGELGDILWYLAGICEDNGWKLEDIAKANLDKLESRQIRGKILGAGSDR